MFCSPITHSTASPTLLFPEPLGPTTAVTPGVKRISVFSANVLKPKISSRLRYMMGVGGWELGVGDRSGSQDPLPESVTARYSRRLKRSERDDWGLELPM